MRAKIIFILLLFANTIFGQGVYKYKDLQIEAKCDKGEVVCDSDLFTFKDSLVQIGIQVYKRSVCCIVITNEYKKPILVKWRRMGAGNPDNGFSSSVAVAMIDADISDGGDKLYIGERKSYVLSNWTDDMFSKRKKNQKGSVHVAIVVDDKLVDYYFDLIANPIK